MPRAGSESGFRLGADDRAVHAVGDRVRELDLDVHEAGSASPSRYSETDSAPAMQPT